MDTLSSAERSVRMSRVKGKDTIPEMVVRRIAHRAGYRYRLHEKTLPGKPDLVFRKRKKVIFVHGCFWHRHEECRLARLPKSRLEFWIPKLEKNKRRDDLNLRKLSESGWNVLIIWECEIRQLDLLEQRIKEFLG
ncbi:very short patch repair endonuclease [Massilia sp. KIM]|uniref:very short patch repair endonuclease n=1 Tax=Massilia sp. KIM TaxID=1955422 RepID=UPI00098F901F|nr:DNA mismatch endonuclease Vsr [Massilia sp. KIM]OON62465.1 very short patch repair endonuclease [Massilia sp. KIM]